MSSEILISSFSSIFVIVLIVLIIIFVYLPTESTTLSTNLTYGTYGTYGYYYDLDNKQQYINKLPSTFSAKSINALYPGCSPQKYKNNPPPNPKINCTNEKRFVMNGKSHYINESINSSEINNIRAANIVKNDDNTIFTITLSES